MQERIPNRHRTGPEMLRRTSRWQKVLEEGLRLQTKRRFGEAERHYRSVLKDNPEHAGALELMGTLAIEAGDPSQAERYFRRAVKFEPDHPLFLNNLGNVLCETEQFEKAIPHLERACRIAPQLSEPHCNLARVYRNLGLTDRAFSCIETARKINRDYPLSILTFAEILTDLGQPDEATRYFRQVISLGVMLPRSLAYGSAQVRSRRPGNRSHRKTACQRAFVERREVAAASRCRQDLR